MGTLTLAVTVTSVTKDVEAAGAVVAILVIVVVN